MPIDIDRFDKEGKPPSEFSKEVKAVMDDLRSSGWEVTKASTYPSGNPDLKAERDGETVYLEVKKLYSRSTGEGQTPSYSVTVMEAQLPRHQEISGSGIPCYMVFVSGKELHYYLRTAPP